MGNKPSLQVTEMTVDHIGLAPARIGQAADVMILAESRVTEGTCRGDRETVPVTVSRPHAAARNR